MNPPRVSIIVPVFNGAGTILETIACLAAQTLPAHELIIVDDGSTDETAALLRRANGIRYLRKENGGPASARNCGVRAAVGEFVAFTDGDCQPAPDWLARLLEGFDDAAVGGVGGVVRSADRNLTGQYVDAVRLLDPEPDAEGEISYLITANACFRTEAIVRAGYFDERFRKPGGEEPELCLRIRKLGYRFRLAEQAVVLHHHRQSAGSLLRTISNYGEGLYLFGQRWPDYRIERPAATFLRRVLSLRMLVGKTLGYRRRYGFAKACYFSMLDYLRHLALLGGYIRAERREA
jgi:glycosyltransferase involved in cell wall biosynthesis